MSRATIIQSFTLLILIAASGPAQTNHDDGAVIVTPVRPGPISDLLRPPGATTNDAYADIIDWSNVPPWRQTSFYGLRAEGTLFVFVVDCSGSMADGGRWLRLRDELRRTITRLRFPQRYLVIFYNDQAWPMPGGMPASATQTAAARTVAWINRIRPDGGTNPADAISMALNLDPHAVFLLSDGAFPNGVAADIIRADAEAKIPIHCVDVSGGLAGDDLKQIAQHTGGHYTRP